VKLDPINMEIAKNPLNWIILFLMVAVAAIGASYVAMNVNNP
jgi:hypothetical protein